MGSANKISVNASAVCEAHMHIVMLLCCRGALPEDSAALNGWQTDAPLLVMGSHTWNTPNDKGRLFCDGVRQERVFKAAASR